MRGRKKEIEDGIRTNIIFSRETFKKAEARGIGNGQFSGFARDVVDHALDSPLDITESDLRKQLQAIDIQRADLTRRLEEISIEREKEQDVRILKEKEAPLISLVLNRIKKMITREFLGLRLSSVVYELGLVSKATNVVTPRAEWVKLALPFARKIIIEDIMVELDNATVDWPKTYSRDEAVRYALVDICGYPESVLTPLSREERLEMIRGSTLKMFPSIIDREDRKRALLHISQLLKAYSLDDPPKQLLEVFYLEGRP